MDKEKLLDQARKRFKLASEAESNQRKREHEDLRFQVPELQWDDQARRARLGNAVPGVPVPPRPMLSIPKLDQPIQLILNQERAAHLGVNIHPLSPDANDDTAEVLQGLYRRIERDSAAGQARTWAFDRAVKVGRGAYRVNTVMDDNGDNPFDQVIRIERLLYQSAVYFDPSATKPDFSDGLYAFVTQWVPIERFKALYPKASLSQSAEKLAFESAEQRAPGWVRGDGENRAILVAEYFWKEIGEETVVKMADGSVKVEDEIEEGEEVDRDENEERIERQREKVTVYWAKMTGDEILEDQQEWNGKYIPLIPVIGRELQPFNEERYFVGVIGPNKDAQRLFNYAASTAVEIAALEPKAPWIIAEGQDKGYEDMWQQSNLRAFPTLKYVPVSLGDQPAPPPTRVQIDSNRLGASMALLSQAEQFIQAGTATYDPSLGRINPKEKSGRAIMALQEQGDQANSNFLHNLADVSMQLEARIILDLIPRIYDRPGRIVRILDEEDGTDTVMLNAPHFMEKGRPVRVPQDESGQPMPMDPRMNPPMPIEPSRIKFHDLSKGIYSVDISIGKSWTSRLQQGQDEIGQILQAQPNLMPLIGPTYMHYRDFPGAREIADILRKVRNQQFPFLEAPEGQEEPSPEQLQAQNQQLKAQLQQMQQQLQMASQAVREKQAQAQASVATAQIKAGSDQRIAQLEAQVRVIVEQMKAQTSLADSAMTHSHELRLAQHDAAHDVAMAGVQAQHAQDGAVAGAAAKAAIAPFTSPNPEDMGSEAGI